MTKTVVVDFNSLDINFNLQTWVVILHFFGIGSGGEGEGDADSVATAAGEPASSLAADETDGGSGQPELNTTEV